MGRRIPFWYPSWRAGDRDREWSNLVVQAAKMAAGWLPPDADDLDGWNVGSSHALQVYLARHRHEPATAPKVYEWIFEDEEDDSSVVAAPQVLVAATVGRPRPERTPVCPERTPTAHPAGLTEDEVLLVACLRAVRDGAGLREYVYLDLADDVERSVSNLLVKRGFLRSVQGFRMGTAAVFEWVAGDEAVLDVLCSFAP